MHARTAWHADGLRWIASLLGDLAAFMDRMDSAPGGRASVCPDEAIDDERARILARYY